MNIVMKPCKYCSSEIPENAKVCPKCQKDLRNGFVRHWIISIILLFIILLIFVPNNSEMSRISDNITKENSSDNTLSNINKIKDIEIIKIKATSLYGEYKANEIKADSLYKNKILEVSGIIENIGKDIFDNPYVALKGGDYIFSIQCMLEDPKKAANLNKGQNIVILGKNSGKMGNILLNECIIKQ